MERGVLMSFQEKIDKLLEEKHVKNLRQLASDVDIPYTTLWDYYSNPVRLEKANLTNIKKIANHLGCTIDYLVFDNILEPNGVVLDNFDIKKDNLEKNVVLDEVELLFDKHKDILTQDDKDYIKFIIEKRKKEIDKELGEE